MIMGRPVHALALLLALAGCGEGSRARSAVESVRQALNPPPPPPDTIPELLGYSPNLGVDIAEMAKLPEGVLWIDLTPGEGDPPAAKGDSVEIGLTSWLPDGTPVDSSVVALRVGTGSVVDGVDLGIPGMKTGGRRQLVVPPGLAYGALGTDQVPPNAVLVYRVDLHTVFR